MLQFREIIKLDSISSTNDYLEDRLVQNKIEFPVAVKSLFQEKGKGYGTNVWHSEKGKNLLISFLVFPGFIHPSRIFVLSQLMSLAIVDLLGSYCHDKVYIKWPNDIFIANKKVAGILIKNELEPGKVRNSILGAGININQEKFPGNIPNPVSLCQLTGNKFEPDELFHQLLDYFIQRYNLMESKGFSEMQDEYLEKLYFLNQKHIFSAAGQQFEGIIRDVMEDGRIKIGTKKDSRIFGFKEVEF